MLKWVQGGVSALTGAVEPIYGPEAFHSISDTVKDKNPYGKLTREDLEWRAPWSSNVETQTFYFNSKSGHYGFVQVIHSNPVGLLFTSQFTCRIAHNDIEEDNIWTSTNIDDFEAKGTNFKGTGVIVHLNEDSDEYELKSSVNDKSLVDFSIKRLGEGFKIGADGVSLYGEDIKNPWGSMRHVFWPRTHVSGSLIINGKEIAIDGHGMYVMALQGMKPHHAASRWNFLNFQGPTTSVVVMEFITPPSYGSSKVSVGAFTKDDKLIATSTDITVTHDESEVDEVGWPRPKKITFDINAIKIDTPDDEITKDPVHIVTHGNLNNLVERIDVMAEIPSFVKKVVSGVSGAKPYIYQFCDPLKVEVHLDGETITEEGLSFCEATFIS